MSNPVTDFLKDIGDWYRLVRESQAEAVKDLEAADRTIRRMSTEIDQMANEIEQLKRENADLRRQLA